MLSDQGRSLLDSLVASVTAEKAAIENVRYEKELISICQRVTGVGTQLLSWKELNNLFIHLSIYQFHFPIVSLSIIPCTCISLHAIDSPPQSLTNLATVERPSILYPTLLYRTWGPCCWYFRYNHLRSWTLCWRTAFTTFYRCVGITRNNKRWCHSPNPPHSNAPTLIRGRGGRKTTKSKVPVSSLMYSDIFWGGEGFNNLNCLSLKLVLDFKCRCDFIQNLWFM